MESKIFKRGQLKEQKNVQLFLPLMFKNLKMAVIVNNWKVIIRILEITSRLYFKNHDQVLFCFQRSNSINSFVMSFFL